MTEFRARYEALRQRIQDVLYHDGIYASGSQVDLVFPLLTGVVPDELRDEVVEKLKNRTQEVYGGHLATGLVGVPVVTEWATKAGECDWLYGLLKQRDYPGYLYMIDNGATGVWEEWDGGRSGGIRALEPGYRRVRIDPQAPEGFDWVKVTQDTPYGPITVYRQGEHLQVSIPVGVTAEIDGKTVGSGEYAR